MPAVLAILTTCNHLLITFPTSNMPHPQTKEPWLCNVICLSSLSLYHPCSTNSHYCYRTLGAFDGLSCHQEGASNTNWTLHCPQNSLYVTTQTNASMRHLNGRPYPKVMREAEITEHDNYKRQKNSGNCWTHEATWRKATQDQHQTRINHTLYRKLKARLR